MSEVDDERQRRDRERARERKKRVREEIATGQRQPSHGTEKGYVIEGCTCEACTRANTEGVARRRQWRREHGGRP